MDPPSIRYRKHLAKRAETTPATSTKGLHREGVPFVYFVQGTIIPLIKIGMTYDVDGRLVSLQVGSPDRLKLLGVIMTPKAETLEGRKPW